MARRTDRSIHLASTRKNLLPRREPYWRYLCAGGHLGFRKTETGSETYVARWRHNTGKRHYKALGRRAYGDAKKMAEQWFADCAADIIHNTTIQGCLKDYVDNLRGQNRESAADEADQRFERVVYGTAFGRIELNDIRACDVQKFRDSLRPNRSPATVNRYLASLKAGLNYGYKHQLARSDRAWKVVEKLEVEEPARFQYLSLAERQALLKHCPDDLRTFLTALFYTGARPGEIAQCRAEDFKPVTGVLVLRCRKGRKRQLRERRFTLDGAGLLFFRKNHRFKRPTTFLFVTSEGRQWLRWLWSRPVRAAVRDAGLPAGTTAYAIRHSVITDWIQAGVDIATVAKATGTSIQMIDDFYFKCIPDMTAHKLAEIKVI